MGPSGSWALAGAGQEKSVAIAKRAIRMARGIGDSLSDSFGGWGVAAARLIADVWARRDRREGLKHPPLQRVRKRVRVRAIGVGASRLEGRKRNLKSQI